MMRRMLTRIEQQDGRIRRRYPKLWHLQTLRVALFTLLGTITAAAAAALTPVTPTNIPSIEPGYFALLLLSAVATCAWLVSVGRPIRWAQVAKPNASPSLALACLHVAALLVPPYAFGTILEWKIGRAISYEEARVKHKILNEYGSWQQDIVNSYHLLIYSKLEKSPSEDKRQQNEVQRTIKRGLNEVSLIDEGDLLRGYFISKVGQVFVSDDVGVSRHYRIRSLILPFSEFEKLKSSDPSYFDKAAANLRRCYTLNLIHSLVVQTESKDLMLKPQVTPDELQGILKKHLVTATYTDKDFSSAIDGWIQAASRLGLTISPSARPSFADFMLAGTLARDVSKTCPQMLIRRRALSEADLLIALENQSDPFFSKSAETIHDLVYNIVVRHGGPNDERDKIKQLFLALPDLQGLSPAGLQDHVSRVVLDIDALNSAMVPLQRAQYVLAGNMMWADQELRFFASIQGISSLLRLELMRFPSRLGHVCVLALCFSAALLLLGWRCVGAEVGIPAFWTAAAAVAILGSVLGLKSWSWVVVIAAAGLSFLLLSIAYGLLRPFIRLHVRVTMAVGLILLPVIAFSLWFHVEEKCSIVTGRIRCFEYDYDIRLPVALAILVLMVAIGEVYLALLRRIVVKPR